jgi:hypothetical protein
MCFDIGVKPTYYLTAMVARPLAFLCELGVQSW